MNKMFKEEPLDENTAKSIKSEGNGHAPKASGFGVIDAGEDIELDKPTPREWLYGNIFARKFMSSVLGEGAVGKTALRYAQYLSLVIGRSLTGDHVFLRCRVMIISLEDDINELR